MLSSRAARPADDTAAEARSRIARLQALLLRVANATTCMSRTIISSIYDAKCTEIILLLVHDH